MENKLTIKQPTCLIYHEKKVKALVDLKDFYRNTQNQRNRKRLNGGSN